MAKRTLEELKISAGEIIGDRSDDAALAFLEDLHDSFSGGGEDWEAKYKENDAAWRKRYKDRFMSYDNDGSALNPDPPEDKDDIEVAEAEKTEDEVMKDLFNTDEEILKDLKGSD